MSSNWGMSYEDWERHAVPATTETIGEAMSYERMGWPMPVSGDLTLRGGRPYCTCDEPVTIAGQCHLCGCAA